MNSSGELARQTSRVTCASIPSNPMDVVITTFPRAMASIILARIPLPESNGTIAISCWFTNATASSTSPIIKTPSKVICFIFSGIFRPAT